MLVDTFTELGMKILCVLNKFSFSRFNNSISRCRDFVLGIFIPNLGIRLQDIRLWFVLSFEKNYILLGLTSIFGDVNIVLCFKHGKYRNDMPSALGFTIIGVFE